MAHVNLKSKKAHAHGPSGPVRKDGGSLAVRLQKHVCDSTFNAGTIGYFTGTGSSGLTRAGVAMLLQSIPRSSEIPDHCAQLKTLCDLRRRSKGAVPRLVDTVHRCDVLIPKQAVETLKKDFNMLLTYRQNLKGITGHPTLRTYREMNRQLIYHECVKRGVNRILNVGDSGHKDVYFGIPSHVLGPVISTADVARHSFPFLTDRGVNQGVTKCGHTLAQTFDPNVKCICNGKYGYGQKITFESQAIEDWKEEDPRYFTGGYTQDTILKKNQRTIEKRFDWNKRAMVLIHSIYYIEPVDLAKAMVYGKYGQAIAVFHPFNGQDGHFWDEGWWTRHEPDCDLPDCGCEGQGITMVCNEGRRTKQSFCDMREAYFHRNVDWILDPVGGVREVEVVVEDQSWIMNWKELRSDTVSMTFSFWVSPKDHAPVRTRLHSVQRLKERIAHRQRQKVIDKVVDEVTTSYMYHCNEGRKITAIIREMKSKLEKAGVQCTAKELSLLGAGVYEESLKLKEEFSIRLSMAKRKSEQANEAMHEPLSVDDNMAMPHKLVDMARTDDLSQFLASAIDIGAFSIQAQQSNLVAGAVAFAMVTLSLLAKCNLGIAHYVLGLVITICLILVILRLQMEWRATLRRSLASSGTEARLEVLPKSVQDEAHRSTVYFDQALRCSFQIKYLFFIGALVGTFHVGLGWLLLVALWCMTRSRALIFFWVLTGYIPFTMADTGERGGFSLFPSLAVLVVSLIVVIYFCWTPASPPKIIQKERTNLHSVESPSSWIDMTFSMPTIKLPSFDIDPLGVADSMYSWLPDDNWNIDTKYSFTMDDIVELSNDVQENVRTFGVEVGRNYKQMQHDAYEYGTRQYKSAQQLIPKYEDMVGTITQYVPEIDVTETIGKYVPPDKVESVVGNITDFVEKIVDKVESIFTNITLPKLNTTKLSEGIYYYATPEHPGECFDQDEFSVNKTMDPTSSIRCKLRKLLVPCQDLAERARVIAEVYGPYALSCVPRLSGDCVHNEKACLLNRQCFDLAVHSTMLGVDELKKAVDWAMGSMDGLFPKWQNFNLTIEEWWDQFKDKVKKKKVMDAWYDHRWDPKRDSKVEAFIKKEMIVGKENKCMPPRLIQGCSAQVHNEIGPYYKTLGKSLKTCWCLKNESVITYASGMNRQQLGNWFQESCDHVEQFGECFVVEADFSKFDKHHSVDHLRFEHMMEYYLKEPTEKIKQVMESTLKVIGGMPKGTKYSNFGGRLSGYQNTTVGNTLMNGVFQLYNLTQVLGEKYGKEIKVPDLWSLPVRMIALGDDSYLITTKEIADSVVNSTHIENCGWGLTKSVAKPCNSTFCSSVFMPCKEGWYLTGLPGRAIAKTFTKIGKLSNITQQMYYANVVARGLLHGQNHNPLISPLLERIINLTQAAVAKVGNKTGFMDDYFAAWRIENAPKKTHANEATYEWIMNRYGLSKSDIAELAQYYAGIVHFKVGLDHWVLRRILAVDIGGIQEDVNLAYDQIRYRMKDDLERFETWIYDKVLSKHGDEETCESMKRVMVQLKLAKARYKSNSWWSKQFRALLRKRVAIFQKLINMKCPLCDPARIEGFLADTDDAFEV